MKEHDSREILVRFLREDLRRAASRDAPVPPDHLEAYVDGRLDDVEREILETRLGDDPALQAEVEALRAVRSALVPEAADRAQRQGPGGASPPEASLLSRLRGAFRARPGR
jgi:anti-sigma factor RsiW